jgi:DNA ligase-associated metallophosphoesterase
MKAAPLHRAGHRFLLDPAGIVFWPAHQILIVADLHLEKASAGAVQGQFIPPYDSRTTLDRLARLARRYRPATIIALGDSFHDSAGRRRMTAEDAARLARLESAQHFVWIAGNHDPETDSPTDCAIDAVTLRHEASAEQPGVLEFSGHFHPKASIITRAARITRPCFVVDHQRVILPSFGAYTGGLDVTAAPIRRLFPRGGQVFLLGTDRLHCFALADAARAARAA